LQGKSNEFINFLVGYSDFIVILLREFRWEGDVGCYGGNNSIVPNFTVVEHCGFASAAPVVRLDYEFPYLPLVKLTSISGKNGQLFIEGVIYGPNDRHHLPTKVVSYTLKLVDNEFVKQ
jgi:hypothetical protein